MSELNCRIDSIWRVGEAAGKRTQCQQRSGSQQFGMLLVLVGREKFHGLHGSWNLGLI